MCRFLLGRFHEPTSPQAFLEAFADMSEQSKALDGDWQGDGWGVAWLDQTSSWQRYTSLAPVWQERAHFVEIPPTTILVAHARAASFAHHKGVLEFNQPYLFDDYAFVFNGLLKGVSLPGIPGRIGAEKICFLVKRALQTMVPPEALESVRELLRANSQEIVALNLGLANKEGIYSLNQFARHPEYYSLHHWNDDSTQLICSEPLCLPAPVSFVPMTILEVVQGVI